MRKFGFTLAEVLITLGIIGVVSALTIPTLIQNYNKKSWDTSASVFEKKLHEALKVMNTQQTLANHENTDSFVDELSKHIRILKICKNDNLSSCFVDNVIWGTDSTDVDMTKVTQSKHFGQKKWKTTIVGAQFANGVNALIAYNPATTQDPYTNEVGTGSLAILYDTNGAKSPNKALSDIRSINVISLGSGCLFEYGDLCITSSGFKPTAHKWNACNADGTSSDPEDLKIMSENNMNYCHNGDDYWAGAAITCGGTNNMPTVAQLMDLGKYLYNTDTILESGNTNNLTLDPEKAAKLSLPKTGFFLWANDDPVSNASWNRAFYPTYTYQKGGYRYHSNRYGLCIDSEG